MVVVLEWWQGWGDLTNSTPCHNDKCRVSAIGSALSSGNNCSLMTLKLDYNASLGSEGIIHLFRGLRTNSTLKVPNPLTHSIMTQPGIKY